MHCLRAGALSSSRFTARASERPLSTSGSGAICTAALPTGCPNVGRRCRIRWAANRWATRIGKVWRSSCWLALPPRQHSLQPRAPRLRVAAPSTRPARPRAPRSEGRARAPLAGSCFAAHAPGSPICCAPCSVASLISCEPPYELPRRLWNPPAFSNHPTTIGASAERPPPCTPRGALHASPSPLLPTHAPTHTPHFPLSRPRVFRSEPVQCSEAESWSKRRMC